MRILAPMSAQAKAPVAAPRGGADALRVRRNGVRGEAGRLRSGRRMSPPLSGRAQDARSGFHPGTRPPPRPQAHA